MGGFTSNSGAFLQKEERVLKRTELILGTVIRSRATVLAPRKSGALRANGKVVDNPLGGKSVVFGDESVPYARIHELGGMTGRGHNTKITAKHYLKTAGDSVVKENIKKYVDMSR